MLKISRFAMAKRHFILVGCAIASLATLGVAPRVLAQSTPTPTPTPRVVVRPKSPPRPTPTPKVLVRPQARPTPTPKVAGRPQPTPVTKAGGRPTPTPRPSPTAGRVLSAQLSVAGPTKVTQCPAQENFTGSVTTGGAADVTYTWVSFDGGTWPQGKLHFSGAGTQKVSEQVRLGTAGQVVHGWMQLKVLSPNALLSPRAQYTLNCPGAGGQGAGRVIRAQVTVSNNLPRNVMAKCPIQENFTGTIATNGAAQVTYTWTSSDNSTWPQATLQFTGAGTQTVKETWTLGGPQQAVSAWVRLKIISPNAYLSNQAAFSFHCP